MKCTWMTVPVAVLLITSTVMNRLLLPALYLLFARPVEAATIEKGESRP